MIDLKRKHDNTEIIKCLEMALSLISEAKGFDGPQGGFVTDHLDAAEMWLDEVAAHLERGKEADGK